MGWGAGKLSQETTLSCMAKGSRSYPGDCHRGGGGVEYSRQEGGESRSQKQSEGEFEPTMEF